MKQLTSFSVFAVVLLLHSPLVAQEADPGTVRIQGVPLEDVVPSGGDFPTENLVDYREEMRRLIQSLTTFAHRLNPQFKVLMRNGLDLMVKIDPVNEDLILPATTFSRTIDGVFLDGLNFVEMTFGTPPNPDLQTNRLAMLERARKAGLKVFVMDYTTDPEKVDQSWAKNSEQGFVSLAAHQPHSQMDSLPPYPTRPFGENPQNIISLDNVKNFSYIGNSAAFGRQDEFAMKMHDTNHDMIFVSVFHGRSPLSRRTIETLKYKKLGSRRLVMAVIDIGSAASYKYYWQDDWQEGYPSFISAPSYSDPDKYHVEYWQPEWRDLITGTPNSFVYGLIAQGYDGVLLEGSSAYRYFENPDAEKEEAELLQSQ